MGLQKQIILALAIACTYFISVAAEDESQILQVGTETYESWVTPKMPTKMKVYLFNVTNVQDFLRNTSKPVLQQLGPYTFSVHQQKTNITFHSANHTVSYRNVRVFRYLANESTGLMNDTVVTLNVPLVSLAYKSEGKLDVFQQLGLNNFIRMYNSTLFHKKAVHELLFDGYQDQLMLYLGMRRGEEVLPNGTFGYLYKKNGTDDGEYTIYTGEDDQSKFLQIAKWEGTTSVDFWNNSYCNRINGTDGSRFRKDVHKEDKLYMFSTSLCRSIYAEYESDSSVHGVNTYKFTLPFSLFASPDIAPENKCFCPKVGPCMLSGALDLSPCKKGSPIVVSGPHFYQGDPHYLETVAGLTPNKEEHETSFDIEPVTGVVKRYSRRLQLNMPVKKMNHITQMRSIEQEVLLPLIWMDVSGETTSEGNK